jgi:hypothetical protein
MPQPHLAGPSTQHTCRHHRPLHWHLLLFLCRHWSAEPPLAACLPPLLSACGVTQEGVATDGIHLQHCPCLPRQTQPLLAIYSSACAHRSLWRFTSVATPPDSFQATSAAPTAPKPTASHLHVRAILRHEDTLLHVHRAIAEGHHSTCSHGPQKGWVLALKMRATTAWCSPTDRGYELRKGLRGDEECIRRW